ncbi:small ribosomal subunit protein eS27-like [Desmodus rotundus]|uniref:small ribosomal subunit protein eS27-like n=1 Tax=Desmodus rotundus TaxID=9430 RepID=UPI0039E239D8
MDVKWLGCYEMTVICSPAQTVVLCAGYSTVLCQPTGGTARLIEGCSFRRKFQRRVWLHSWNSCLAQPTIRRCSRLG